MKYQTTKERIEQDPDFVNLKKFDFSLRRMLEKYPNGAPDRIISQALQIPEAEINQHFQSILQKLKEQLDDNEKPDFAARSHLVP